ncbi:MAG: SPOR domain-containing protein [Treponema sp.]|nr:SPOR domain-containing protein [Treponema sp.]
MEQKKTLWVSLSVGIFLLFVLGTAIVIYSPGARNNTNAIAMRDSGLIYTASLPPQSASQGSLISTGTNSPAPASGTYSPSSTTGTDIKTDSVTVIADTANVYAKETVSSSPSSSSPTSVSYNTNSGSASASNVTAMNQKGEVAIKETGNKKKFEEPAPAKSSQTAKAPAAGKATESKATATTVKAPSTATASSSSASSKPSSSVAPHYWVQVASYSTKDNADEARKVLDAKDLPCEVFTFTKDSKLYYRVRVGPYKTKGEAETCKKSVDSIALFKSAQSYVVDSSARASR